MDESMVFIKRTLHFAWPKPFYDENSALASSNKPTRCPCVNIPSSLVFLLRGLEVNTSCFTDS